MQMLISLLLSFGWTIRAYDSLTRLDVPGPQRSYAVPVETALISRNTVGDGRGFLSGVLSLLVDPDMSGIPGNNSRNVTDGEIYQRCVEVEKIFDTPAAADALNLRYVDPTRTNVEQALSVAAAYGYLASQCSGANWQYNGVDIRDRRSRYQKLAKSWAEKAEDRYRTEVSPRSHTMLAFAAILSADVEDDPHAQFEIADSAMKLGPFDHESVASVLELEKMAALLRLNDPLGFRAAWDEHLENHPKLQAWEALNPSFEYTLIQWNGRKLLKDFDELLDGYHEESPQ
jgi:hypothetical protein